MEIINKKYFNYLQLSNDLYLSKKLEQLRSSYIEDFSKFLNLTQSFIIENKPDLIEYIAYIGTTIGIKKYTKMPKILMHCDGLRMTEKLIVVPKEQINFSNDDIVRGHIYAVYDSNDNYWKVGKSLTENTINEYKYGDTYSSLKFLFEWNWIREDFVSTDAWNYNEYINQLSKLDSPE